MTECHACETIYKIILSEDFEDETPQFCPICGERKQVELDFDEMDL